MKKHELFWEWHKLAFSVPISPPAAPSKDCQDGSAHHRTRVLSETGSNKLPSSEILEATSLNNRVEEKREVKYQRASGINLPAVGRRF